jgi:hypothetical protein
MSENWLETKTDAELNSMLSNLQYEHDNVGDVRDKYMAWASIKAQIIPIKKEILWRKIRI